MNCHFAVYLNKLRTAFWQNVVERLKLVQAPNVCWRSGSESGTRFVVFKSRLWSHMQVWHQNILVVILLSGCGPKKHCIRPHWTHKPLRGSFLECVEHTGHADSLTKEYGARVRVRLGLRSFTLPYLISGVDRLLHLPSAETVSARPNALLWM